VVCPFVLFLLAIVLSVLRFTNSDYPFGIFKLSLQYLSNDFNMFSYTYIQTMVLSLNGQGAVVVVIV